MSTAIVRQEISKAAVRSLPAGIVPSSGSAFSRDNQLNLVDIKKPHIELFDGRGAMGLDIGCFCRRTAAPFQPLAGKAVRSL